MRIFIIAIVAAFFFCAGCVEETTEFCDDACTICAENECWDFDICMEACEDERDWDKGYLECLQEADSTDCQALEACG